MEQQNKIPVYEIQCDKCGKNISKKIQLKARTIISDIKQHYFDCPFCGKRYPCYYTNKHMRSLMKQIVTPEIKEKLLFEANSIEKLLKGVEEKKNAETQL